MKGCILFVFSSLLGMTCFLLAGCAQMGSTTTDTGGTYIAPDEQLVMTAGLDDHDYDLVARAVSDEFKKRGLPRGYVVVLGPVDTHETPYDVRAKQLQSRCRRSSIKRVPSSSWYWRTPKQEKRLNKLF